MIWLRCEKLNRKLYQISEPFSNLTIIPEFILVLEMFAENVQHFVKLQE